MTNSLISGDASDVVPSFGIDGADIVYVNKEYIRDIYLPLQVSNFTPIDIVSLNPGLSASFPWLAQIAINFEEYEFLQLAFTFKSSIENTTTATNGQVGQILMTTNYNPDAAPFGSKEEMMLYKGGMSCKSTQSMIHGVECDPNLNAGTAQKFVRPGFTHESLKQFDLGVLNIAALNAPAQYLGQCLGELWCSYTVRLRKPKVCVGENYSVIRSELCASSTSTEHAFGEVGSGLSQFATRSTIPDLQFIFPISASGTSYPDIMPGHPTGYTVPIIWDNMDEALPEAFIQGSTPTPMHVGVQFPAYWSGICSIRLKEKFKFNADGYPYLKCCAQGQIFRFKDIPWDTETSDASGTLPNVWTHKLNGSGKSTVATYLQENDYTLHIKVQPVQNGVQNVVYFGLDQAGLPGSVCLRAFVDVVGLQTYQSYDDSGMAIPSTRLELTNSDTLQTQLWN